MEDSSKQSKFKTRSFLNICDHLNETNSVQRSEEEEEEEVVFTCFSEVEAFSSPRNGGRSEPDWAAAFTFKPDQVLDETGTFRGTKGEALNLELLFGFCFFLPPFLIFAFLGSEG